MIDDVENGRSIRLYEKRPALDDHGVAAREHDGHSILGPVRVSPTSNFCVILRLGHVQSDTRRFDGC